MSDTDTPRTDAAVTDCALEPVPADFARALERENGRLREALEQIARLCQLTCVSYESQSMRATELARAALAGEND